jgi:glycosyltransferase involved in cell wall biosynthesis
MIFAGPLFDRTEESTIKSNIVCGRIQNQANTFQWNCIDGLIANGINIRIINALPVGVFPTQYKKLILSKREWSYQNTANIEVGCINLPVIKQMMRFYGFRNCFRKENDEKHILLYSTYYPLLKAIRHLPSYYKVVLIVTDLPEFYDSSDNTNKLFDYLRRRNNKKIYNCLERIDGYVLLTEEMRSALKIEGKPYVIVEGICGRISDSVAAKNNGCLNVLYTGTLNRKFGIEVLVKAFQTIKGNNYRTKDRQCRWSVSRRKRCPRLLRRIERCFLYPISRYSNIPSPSGLFPLRVPPAR